MRKNLLEVIQENVLLGDGAMGTQLHEAGLGPGECGELWNIEQPGKILAIQRRYVEAGSDCIITNTFGGNPVLLRKRNLEEKCHEIHRAAAEIARRAVGEDGYVLGDLGPFGDFLQPLGKYSEEEIAEAFAAQAMGLLEGGADAIIIETMGAIEEVTAAIRGARKAGAKIVIASMTYTSAGDNFHTMTGATPEEAGGVLDDLGADIIGVNCGTGLDIQDQIRIVQQYTSVTKRPIIAQPNAGSPEMVEGRVIYRETPEKMASHVAELAGVGARIIGGCCGTTPDHIRLFRAEVDRFNSTV